MRRSSIIDIFAAASVLLLAGAAYTFWYATVEQSADEAAVLIAEIQERGEIGGRAARARQQLEELKADEALVYRYLVSNNEIVPFLESLERTGEQLDADVEVISVSRGQETQNSTIMLALSIKGTFDAVLRTLGAIEYQPYDTRLVNVTLDTAADTNVWTAAAIIAVGTLTEKETTTSTSTPNEQTL